MRWRSNACSLRYELFFNVNVKPNLHIKQFAGLQLGIYSTELYLYCGFWVVKACFVIGFYQFVASILRYKWGWTFRRNILLLFPNVHGEWHCWRGMSHSSSYFTLKMKLSEAHAASIFRIMTIKFRKIVLLLSFGYKWRCISGQRLPGCNMKNIFIQKFGTRPVRVHVVIIQETTPCIVTTM